MSTPHCSSDLPVFGSNFDLAPFFRTGFDQLLPLISAKLPPNLNPLLQTLVHLPDVEIVALPP